MTIALSTDHAGLKAIKRLQIFLEAQGYICQSFAPASFNADDDYPDFIRPAAEAVASGVCERGVIMGGSGQGEAMVANRVTGVRCALYYGPARAVEPIDASGTSAIDDFEILRLSRQHNDANMLSIAARFVNQTAIEQAVLLWLETTFSGQERHMRRIHKIDTTNL